jgi:hypothetical protein
MAVCIAFIPSWYVGYRGPQRRSCSALELETRGVVSTGNEAT